MVTSDQCDFSKNNYQKVSKLYDNKDVLGV